MRLAAILLVLRARADGEPELLMIKRAEAEEIRGAVTSPVRVAAWSPAIAISP